MKLFSSLFALLAQSDHGKFVGRTKARDVAYTYRMGAGFVGDVNRTHPASIEPAVNDATNPILGFGLAAVVNAAANSVRIPAAGDTAAEIYGVTVRPFPFQQRSGGDAAAFGGEGPVASTVIDILRSGYIMVLLGGATPATKGAPVFVRIQTPSAGKVVGDFEAAADGGNTVALDAKSTFNGPADANGITELAFNI